MNNVPALANDGPQAAPVSAQELRNEMVQQLIEKGVVRKPRVVTNFRKVLGHLIASAVEMVQSYNAESALIPKPDESSVGISAVLAPRIQAMQLEQAEIQSGMNRRLPVPLRGGQAEPGARPLGPVSPVRAVGPCRPRTTKEKPMEQSKSGAAAVSAEEPEEIIAAVVVAVDVEDEE
ncbi:hypothetical protein AB0E04_44155 [Streptomyces sp. NPDC048251]|uniref:hypothetical protein n=1 Tax=Streptomyces sp. NPDC048251 TaxID=3154501 RepID=UPI00342E4A43